MKKLILALTILTLVMLPMAAMAAPIAADLTGNRNLEVPKGLSGEWGDDDEFTFSWEITKSGSVYTYCYTIENEDPALSNWVLQISPLKKLTDFSNFKIKYGSTVKNYDTDDLEVDTFTKLGNQNLPSGKSIYGIKFDNISNYTEDLKITFYFDTELDPVWGDFAAKGGQDLVYNTGLGEDPSSPFTNWVARPDGAVVPIPGSLLLLGSGLLGLVGIRRKLS